MFQLEVVGLSPRLQPSDIGYSTKSPITVPDYSPEITRRPSTVTGYIKKRSSRVIATPKDFIRSRKGSLVFNKPSTPVESLRGIPLRISVESIHEILVTDRYVPLSKEPSRYVV